MSAQEDFPVIPTGFRLIVEPVKIEEKTEGGIFLPDQVVDDESLANITGKVVLMGDLAYSDTERFPTGPWCKVGDYVLFGKYSGKSFLVGGDEYRMLNDDQILGIVTDPNVIRRNF